MLWYRSGFRKNTSSSSCATTCMNCTAPVAVPPGATGATGSAVEAAGRGFAGAVVHAATTRTVNTTKAARAPRRITDDDYGGRFARCPQPTGSQCRAVVSALRHTTTHRAGITTRCHYRRGTFGTIRSDDG